MRLWSLHPSLLDRQGLMGLWREALLARHVLLGLTKGYTKHPQLNRFRSHPDSLLAIDFYLAIVCQEGRRRGYNFDMTKFQSIEEIKKIDSNYLKMKRGEGEKNNEELERRERDEKEKEDFNLINHKEFSPLPCNIHSISVNNEQVNYELIHLRKKLQSRNPSLLSDSKYNYPSRSLTSLLHPLFYIVPGPIEEWERPYEIEEKKKIREKIVKKELIKDDKKEEKNERKRLHDSIEEEIQGSKRIMTRSRSKLIS